MIHFYKKVQRSVFQCTDLLPYCYINIFTKRCWQGKLKAAAWIVPLLWWCTCLYVTVWLCIMYLVIVLSHWWCHCVYHMARRYNNFHSTECLPFCFNKTLVAKKPKAVDFGALLLWWWYYTKDSILGSSWSNMTMLNIASL